MSSETPSPTRPERSDFIRDIVAADLRAGRHRRSSPASRPSPTATSTSATPSRSASTSASRPEFGGQCNLRFDDTNPVKEEQEYIDAIQADVRWLGFDWGENLFYASDYFEQLYAWAVHLIEHGKAFVDDLTADEIRETRGTLTEPGTNSPYRDRSVDENLDLFARMRAGEFANGARVLRAKIDMAAPNINLRDPVLYRIVHATHPRTGDAWCIYPTYDYAHGQSRRDRGRDPLAVHARVRRPSGALRLAHREPARAVGPPPVRVRAAQPHLLGAVQAVPAQARQRRARPRLGRSPDAHDRWTSPARLSRPRASATSPTRSASPRPTASTSSRCWSTRSATC